MDGRVTLRNGLFQPTGAAAYHYCSRSKRSRGGCEQGNWHFRVAILETDNFLPISNV